jgi:serine/threonine-protein kinase HipA
MTNLTVFWDSVFVGQLIATGRLDMSFAYSPDYLARDGAHPISFSMPLQAEPFSSELTKSWFANLLPEGEVRTHVARELRVSERNDFALLGGLGGDCAGALRIVPESTLGDVPGTLTPLSWLDIEQRIALSPRPSLLALMIHEDGLRLSLAGAQDKLPVHWADGVLSLPDGAAASTHLLKISNDNFPGLVYNELFCMTLAKHIGLNVPSVQLAPTETPILMVERYDRRTEPDGRVTRLHQEDFCQALGMPPEMKYQNEGGPSTSDMFSVLAEASTSPLLDKRALIAWVIFNYLIGNADAHAKNVSLLMGSLDDRTEVRLAPVYDLVCTEIYGSLNQKLAQKIGGEYRPKIIGARHWERFADSIGVKPGYLWDLVNESCDRVDESAAMVAEEMSREFGCGTVLASILDVIGARTKQLRVERTGG